MSKIKDFNEIKQYIEELGYQLISTKYINSNNNLILKDSYNYLYSISLSNLYNGRKPHIVHKNNPYSIHNIKIFLKNNNYDFILLSEKYEGEDINLKLCDSEGYYYSQTWRTLLKLTRQLFVSGNNIYSTQNIQLFLYKNNIDLKLINQYKSNKEKLILVDSKGYLYTSLWSNLQKLWLPDFVNFSNTYSIQNIHLWCTNNNKPYKLLSTEYKRNNQLLLWKCLNDGCGEEFKMCWGNILQGQNCSYCKESKGERKINTWLKQESLPYDKQYTFEDLIGINGGLLRFDSVVFSDKEKSKLKMIIEYDGKQHFECIKGWQTEEQFKLQQYHDKLKNEYCKTNNIKLLRIPYWDFDNIEKILSQELIK